jgi:hypothetical protein
MGYPLENTNPLGAPIKWRIAGDKRSYESWFKQKADHFVCRRDEDHAIGAGRLEKVLEWKKVAMKYRQAGVPEEERWEWGITAQMLFRQRFIQDVGSVRYMYEDVEESRSRTSDNETDRTDSCM